ncbi:hypothetical protein E2C01_026897 [Portunus trituberculatus]|uniref:Uncharacterized protein n=1 Tax=Portunus trituberculatus TaxID=210409 RepID=A0A5B7EHB6_PORTR|nr:hypothetical protein [Portunus trituberculatus]
MESCSGAPHLVKKSLRCFMILPEGPPEGRPIHCLPGPPQHGVKPLMAGVKAGCYSLTQSLGDDEAYTSLVVATPVILARSPQEVGVAWSLAWVAGWGFHYSPHHARHGQGWRVGEVFMYQAQGLAGCERQVDLQH